MSTIIARGTQVLNMDQGNTSGEEFRLYRVAGKAVNLIREDGKRLEVRDGWLRTDVIEDIQFLDKELARGGFGPAVWKATDADKEEYAQYVDPKTRQVQDVVALLSSNPTLAAQVAETLNNIEGAGSKALAAALSSGAAATVARKVTVGGKQHELGGIKSSQTIATVSNGSNSEDTTAPAGAELKQ
mgnify:FL=1